MDVLILRDGFEGGFHQQDDIPELQIPVDWRLLWVPPQAGDEPGYHVRPECRREVDRKHGGECCLKIAHTSATWDTYLIRLVDIANNMPFELDAWGKFVSITQETGKGGGMAMRIGVDPLAQLDPWSGDILWGNWEGQEARPRWDGKAWHRFSVSGRSLSSRVTILLQARCKWKATINAAFWDSVTLVGHEADIVPDGRWQVLAKGLIDVGTRLIDLGKELQYG